jgi:hypothetical protein
MRVCKCTVECCDAFVHPLLPHAGTHSTAVAKIKAKPFLKGFTADELTTACSLLDRGLLVRYGYAVDCPELNGPASP